jgi:hypothetical protein
MLLFCGRGGGSIWVDVLRDAVCDESNGCCGGAGAVGRVPCGLGTPRGDLGTEFKSGAMVCLSLYSSTSTARHTDALGYAKEGWKERRHL